ncbi:MAG: ATP-binding protein [Halobacteriales archaeon]|nr:ATP-binding protein [Halobacteriales archaeon]
MAEQETKIQDVEQVSLESVVTDGWEMVKTPNASLYVVDSKQFEADSDRLQQVFENLFKNTVEHNNGEITVRVGTTENGIFIEDTGKGIPRKTRDKSSNPGLPPKRKTPGSASISSNKLSSDTAGTSRLRRRKTVVHASKLQDFHSSR